jgi:photosystem II stability/assembly factor-like uncharacterized protein
MRHGGDELRFNSVRALERWIEQLKAGSGRDADMEGRPGAEAENGADYLEAYLYYLRQRAYPRDTVDWSEYRRAEAHRDALPPARIGAGVGILPQIGGTWEFVGPNNLAAPYRIYNGLGPLSGRVNAIAYDPQKAGVLYIGAAGGGLWKTADSGQTWTCLSDGWPAEQVSSIAIDPTNHNTIYVGTGDFPGYGALGFGLMKTTDGGQTWTNLGNAQFGNCAVSSVVVDPENPKIITVAPGRPPAWWAYVWRSTDGGNTWTSVINVWAHWSRLAYGAKATNGSRYLYATGHDNGGQVYRSANRGKTWTKLSPPLSDVNWYDQNSLQIATSPTQPNTVYLITGFDRKIFKSTNAGAKWTDITGDIETGANNYNWSQADYDLHITCGSRTVGGKPQDVLYVGLIDLEQSLGGGAKWRSLGGPTYNATGSLLHNDQHCVAVNPSNPTDVLVGCDGGLYQLNFNSAWSAWTYTSLNPAIGITQLYHAAYHQTDPTTMIGGAQDNATPAALGDLAQWANIGGGDGGFCAINPNDETIKYVTSQNLQIYRVNNAWSNVVYLSLNWGSDKVAFIAPIALDMNNPSLLYAATNYLYQWNEATQSWRSRLGNQSLDSKTGAGYGHYVQFVALAPGDSSRIYTGSVDGDVYMTTDAGSTWTAINTGVTSLPNLAVTSIAVSPTSPGSILVGLSGTATGTGHLWACNNTRAGAARTWTNVSGTAPNNLPDVSLNSIALDPKNPATTWYVGTDVGVFATSNAGATWQNATTPLGLPNVQVNDVQADAGTGYLNAATYGRGIWRIPLP